MNAIKQVTHNPVHHSSEQKSVDIGPTAAELCRAAIDSAGAVLLVPGLLSSLTPELDAADTRRLRQLLGLSRQPVIFPESSLEVSAENSAKTAAVTDSASAQMIGLENLAMTCLLPQQKKSCAAFLTYQSDFPQKPSAQVLRVDPAYQQIDMNNATVTDPSLLALSNDESDALLLTMNKHFAEDGMLFEYKAPQRWYCHFTDLPDINTVSLRTAIGHDVSACRPVGPDARLWRSKLAEIEMLLFEHPVNEARQALGKLPINTLWVWGEGGGESESNLPKLTTPKVEVATDDFYTQSLASHCDVSQHVLATGTTLSLTPNQATLFVVNKIAASAATGDHEARLQELLWLEEFVCKLLWQNLKKDGWPVIVIWCGGTQFFEIDASVRNKFWLKAWRKPPPLSAFVVADENPQASNV